MSVEISLLEQAAQREARFKATLELVLQFAEALQEDPVVVLRSDKVGESIENVVRAGLRGW